MVSFVDPMDLVALVGNALDNAIDAAAQLEDTQHRRVRLTLAKRGAFAVLTVENPYEGDVELVDGLPKTTKRSTVHHGDGVRNMRDIAERYGGNLRATGTGGWFVVHMLLAVLRQAPAASADAGAGPVS